jgi:HlyD family secretion protein
VLRGASVTPVKIKTGISDGIFTEVTEGLNEGDRVVTAITGSLGNSAQSNNPFSGASRRF